MSFFTGINQPSTGFSLFDALKAEGHEQVIACSDSKTGLRALIAIHNTTLGPSLGGVRMWSYDSEGDALKDVLRLSKGMTYKAALAGLQLGGGKAVIIGDPKKDKNEALFRVFGRYINGLAGRYITAEDVGVTVRDMEWIHKETKYVTGLPKRFGGSGDPSPFTALGVYLGMKAAMHKHSGSDSLENKSIVIQGAGKVSSSLVELLHKEHARIWVSDIDREKTAYLQKWFGVTPVEPKDIFSITADVFSPCALGGILNSETIPSLKAPIIAGAANNQLQEDGLHGQMINERGILYIPDFVLNAGGLINVASELEGYDEQHARSRVQHIYDTVTRILDMSSEKQLPTLVTANQLAEKRLNDIQHIHSIFTSDSTFPGRLSELYKGSNK